MTLSEDAAPLSPVVIVTANDEDKGEDGKISYSILSITTGKLTVETNIGTQI